MYDFSLTEVQQAIFDMARDTSPRLMQLIASASSVSLQPDSMCSWNLLQYSDSFASSPPDLAPPLRC